MMLSWRTPVKIEQHYRIILTAILILAVVIRAVYFLSYHPPLAIDLGDSPAYDMPAWNVVSGNGYVYEPGVPFAAREPGYALYWLVPIYFFFGHSVAIASLLQLGLDVVMLGLVMLFLKRYSSAPIALLAGFIYAIYLPFTFQNAEILTEPLYQFALLGLVWLLTYHFTQPRWYTSGLIGLVIGAIALIRWGAVLIPPFVILAYWVRYHNWRKAFGHTLLVILGMLIFTTPWIVRNYQLFDAFVFGRIGGGIMYWTGSYPPYDGEWRADAMSDQIGANLSPIESDKVFTRAALDNIRQYPLQVAWIWLKKPVKIFMLPEAYNYMNRTGVSILISRDPVIIFWVGYAVVLHWLLLIAAVLSYRWRTLSAPAQWSCSVILLFSLALYIPLNPVVRYNVPVMPMVIILASPILYQALLHVQRRFIKV